MVGGGLARQGLVGMKQFRLVGTARSCGRDGQTAAWKGGGFTRSLRVCRPDVWSDFPIVLRTGLAEEQSAVQINELVGSS